MDKVLVEGACHEMVGAMMEKKDSAMLPETGHISFRDFVQQHEERVRNICWRFLHNEEDAEEVAQDVFVEVYRSRENFRGESRLSTWVYRIAVNKSIDFIRKQKRNKRFGLIKKMFGLAEVENILVDRDNSDPDKAIEQQQRNAILWRAVESLPENQCKAIVLIKYEQCSYKEAADIIGVSVSSVESLIHRAKSNLQKKLYQHYEKIF